MRSLLRLPLVAATLALGATASSSASAHPVPRITQGADGQWRMPPEPPAPTLPISLPPIESTDILSQDLVLDLDPTTQQLAGTLTLTIRAEEPGVSSVIFLLDASLSVTSAEADGVIANVSEQTFGTFTQVTVGFGPMALNQELQLVVSYGGQLACAGPGALCDVNPSMGVMMRGSGIPYLFDESGLGGYNVWGATLGLEMTVPSGIDVVAPGTLLNEQDDGVTVTRSWQTPGYHNTGAYLVLFGDFDALPVAGSSPPTTVFHEASSPVWADSMSGWMTTILAFLDDQAGSPLAFDALSCVKLPADWVFPGTVAHGTVYLAESYGDPGPAYFEETLAHETSHDWWGVLVSPTDYLQSRWLVEGLATLSQIDYAALHHAGGLDRNAFLERRYREHAQVLRHLVTDSAAVVPAIPPDLEGLDDTFWAYIRSSAALDSLRLVVGEEAFADGLRAYASQCQQAHCDTADFRVILESVSGLDLTLAFESYVYREDYPAFTIDHAPAVDGVSVSAQGLVAPLMVDLLVELESGAMEHRSVTLDPQQAISVAASGPVRSVQPNPRHAATLRFRSAQPGDVTFDRDVDGVDVVTCARLVGKEVGQVPNGEGVFLMDLDFDTRCDLDDDGAITEIDLQLVMERFGTLAPEAL